MPRLTAQLEINQCPHCSVNSPNLNTVHVMETESRLGKKKRYWHVYVCQRCGGVVVAATEAINGEIVEIHPTVAEIDDSIPNPVREYLSQAAGSIHAPAGAIMLAASAVDAMLKMKTIQPNQTMQKWLSKNPKIDKPARIPEQRGDLTITYIHNAADAEEHTGRVREWARDVWGAWSEHHALARRLISEATTENKKR